MAQSNYNYAHFFGGGPTGSSSVLTLSPPELIVLEGGDAIMTCSPFYPLEPLLLVHVQQDLLTVLTTSSEPRLTHEDFVVSNAPLLSNRTYTLKGVSRHDDNRRFHCVLGDWTSNEVTLRVYGKFFCSWACTRKLVSYIVQWRFWFNSYNY